MFFCYNMLSEFNFAECSSAERFQQFVIPNNAAALPDLKFSVRGLIWSHNLKSVRT